MRAGSRRPGIGRLSSVSDGWRIADSEGHQLRTFGQKVLIRQGLSDGMIQGEGLNIHHTTVAGYVSDARSVVEIVRQSDTMPLGDLANFMLAIAVKGRPLD